MDDGISIEYGLVWLESQIVYKIAYVRFDKFKTTHDTGCDWCGAILFGLIWILKPKMINYMPRRWL